MFGFFVNFSFRLCYNKCMDQNKVNPFSENPASSAGSAPAPQSSPNVPVNPYAPAGAPYAPGSNTPPPDYAITSGDAPAVPNTAPRFSTPDPAFTSVPNNYPSAGPEKPKFFTKKFVILASAGVVLILAAVITGIILQNNRKNNGTSINTTSSNATFNSYMNYILVGNHSSSTYQNEYSASKIYYIEESFNNINGYNRSVANEVAVNWGQAYTTLTDAQKNLAAVKDYNALVETFRLYSQISPLSDEELLSAYANGQDGDAYLEDYYSAYNNSSSVYAKNFGKILTDQGKAAFAKYQIYAREGCLSSNTLDDECIGIKTLSADDQKIMFDYNQLTSQKEATLADYITTLVTSIWDVEHAINGETQS